MNKVASTQQKNVSRPAMKQASGILQRKCACGTHTIAGGECEACDKERRQSGTTSNKGAGEAPPIVHDVLRSAGRPLDSETRGFMESRFHHDFSLVRVHTDARAAQSAQAVNAIAYTVGQNVVFGHGRYAPEARDGRRLLAHELAHVVQQSGRTAAPSLTLGKENDAHEREADSAALRVSSGSPLHHAELPNTPITPRVQRQTEDTEADEALDKDKEREQDEKHEGHDDEKKSKKKKKKKKLPPAERGRKIRVGDFVGDLFHRLLGKPQPKYFKHSHSSSDKQEPQEKPQYETVKKIVTVTKSDSDDESVMSPETWTGNKPHTKGEPKTRTFPYKENYEALLFAQPDPADTPRGGTLLNATTTTTVTGTFKFSLGEKSDKPTVGGLGRIRISALDVAVTGMTTIVYDTDWITTLGVEQTVTLTNLPANAQYIIEVGVEQWHGGHTEYRYDLKLHQKTTTVSKFEVAEKKRVKK